MRIHLTPGQEPQDAIARATQAVQRRDWRGFHRDSPAAAISTKDDQTTAAQRIYGRNTSDARVIVVDGFGISLTVKRGQLIVKDGFGKHRRERTYAQAERVLRRIIIAGRDGYLSLGALDWCRHHHVSVVTLNPYGELVSINGPEEPASGVTARAQVLCMTDGPHENVGVDVVREILARKLREQARVARNVLGDAWSSAEVLRNRERLISETGTESMRQYEAVAARLYFAAWRQVSMEWSGSVPEHWTHPFKGRHAPHTPVATNALDPLNAVLNYTYAMLRHEAHIAVLSAGLHPQLGYLHMDLPYSDALAYDVMEVGRPLADEFVLSLMNHPGNYEPHVFHPGDFREMDGKENLPPGTIRISAELRHHIAEYSIRWAAPLNETAEIIAHAVGDAARGRYRPLKPTRDKSFGRHDSKAVQTIPAPTGNQPWEVVFGDASERVKELVRQLPAPGKVETNYRVAGALAYRTLNGLTFNECFKPFGVSRSLIAQRNRVWVREDAWSKIIELVTQAHSH